VASDEADGFQHLDMARNCWLAHLKRFADVHNPDITTREARQNRTPRLISEGSKNTVDAFGGRFSCNYIIYSSQLISICAIATPATSVGASRAIKLSLFLVNWLIGL
jgi:hypothetical protein